MIGASRKLLEHLNSLVVGLGAKGSSIQKEEENGSSIQKEEENGLSNECKTRVSVAKVTITVSRVEIRSVC